MQVRTWTSGALILMTSCLAITLESSEARAQEGLRPEDYGAILLVVKQELSAIGNRAIKPVCIRGPITKVPPKSLLRFLSTAGIDVHGPKQCYPSGKSPRGIEISLSDFAREPGSSLKVTVETGDITPRPGVHVGELLRLGTYELKEAEGGAWMIVSYKNARPGH